MQQSSDTGLSFVSSNRHKYDEVREILLYHGIRANHVKSRLSEIQSNVLDEIASAKARDAFSKFDRPVLVEDDGLFVDSLGGFPGPYASYVFDTIGITGLLKLLQGYHDRLAKFVSVIVYDDGVKHKIFKATLCGMISDKPQNGIVAKGWGYDPVFVPKGYGATFAEMTTSEKISISHRRIALDKFCSWYK